LTVATEGGRPPERSSPARTEGTALRSVTSSAAGRVGRARAFSARITRPPRASGTKISKTERSKQIEVEARTPESAAAGKTSRAQSTRATALACSIATPLGRPVDPEV
jgi:hypothetical protein